MVNQTTLEYTVARDVLGTHTYCCIVFLDAGICTDDLVKQINMELAVCLK